MENRITTEILQKLCIDETIIMTQHLTIRCNERNIKYDNIKTAISEGEIIEQYPTDYPYPSCLILGVPINAKYLHVVVGLGDNKLWIITAYYPNLDKWENNFKTRKVVN